MDKLRIAMWKTLQINGGYYGVLVILSNCVFQFKAIVKPFSDTHRMVNIIYSATTVISILLYILAYYKKNTKFILPAFSIVMLRNAIRLFDFEGTVAHLTETEWVILCISQWLT